MVSDGASYARNVTPAELPGERRAEKPIRLMRVLVGAIFFLSVGVLYSLYVFGPRAFNPTHIDTLPFDSAQAYMGWLFFRHQSHLTLPLGWAPSLGYPYGEPIAYLDSLPLVATLFWPFRHWLPEPFQYLTLWWALCAALSFYFGSRICRRLCGGDWLVGLSGGLLFMTAPILLWRAQAHFALSSHWLILAALEFYLACSATLSRRYIAAGVSIAAISGGINPYISVMALMLVGAGYLRSTLTGLNTAPPLGQRLLVAIFGIGAAATAMVLAWLLFGFLRPSDPGAYAGEKYGDMSMNLLAPINPWQYPALLLKWQPFVTIWQAEGYNYFGLGVLILGLVVFVRAPRKVVGHLLQRDAWPGWLVVIVSTLLALSVKITIGSHLIYELPLPSPLYDLFSAFRASGRLFWPGYYLVLAGIVSASFIVFGKRTAVALLCVLAVQIADLRGMRNDIREGWSKLPVEMQTHVTENMFTDSAVWQDIGRQYRHLVVLPAWQCAFEQSPASKFGFWIFGKLAGEHAMTLNSFYPARVSDIQRDDFCRRMPEDLQRSGFAQDTAYVFATAAQAYPIRANGHSCRALDDVILCVKSDDAAKFGQDMRTRLPVLPMDTTISLSASNPASSDLFGLGWWNGEDWGRWTLGREASVTFQVQGNAAVQIDLAATALTSPSHPQDVQIYANGQHLKDWHFADGSEGKISLKLASDIIGPERIVTLSFITPDASSPAQLGLSDDPRQIGMGLKSIEVRPE